MKNKFAIKPINLLIYSTTILIIIGGCALIYGWIMQEETLLLTGKNLIVIAIVVSFFPLFIIGIVNLWFFLLQKLNLK